MKVALKNYERTYGSSDKFVDLEAVLPSQRRATIGSLAWWRRLVGKGPVIRAPPQSSLLDVSGRYSRGESPSPET